MSTAISPARHVKEGHSATTSGKYAGLPDIDEASADVYETEDVFPLQSQGLTDDRDPYDSDDSLEALRNARSSAAATGGRSHLFPFRSKNASASGAEGEVDVIETDALPRSKDVRRRLTRDGGEPSSWRLVVDAAAAKSRAGRPPQPPRSARAQAEADANRLARLRRETEMLEARLTDREKEEGKEATSAQTLGNAADAVADHNSDDSDASYESETSFGSEEGDHALSHGRRRRKQTSRRRPPPPTASELLQQLAALRADGGTLDRLERRIGGGDGLRSTNTGSDPANGILESLKEGAKVDNDVGGPSVADDAQPPGESASARISTKTCTAEQLAELDGRLGKLERSVGVGSMEGAELDRSRPLLPSIERLESLVSLLAEPKQLDTVSRRIKLLLADLEKSAALASKTGSTVAVRRPPPIRTGDSAASPPTDDPSADAAAATARIDALFSLLPRIEPVLPVLPPLVTRLRSLDALHSSAAGFADVLASMESSQRSLEAGHADMDDVTERVEESLKKQAEAAQKNWDSLQERLIAVVTRLQALEK